MTFGKKSRTGDRDHENDRQNQADTDAFFTYGMGKPWVEYSWLFDVISAAAFARLGFLSIALYEVVVRLALSLALFHLVAGLFAGFWRAAGLTAVALYAMTVILGPRPGMVSILFVILTFDISTFRSAHGTWREYLVVPPMFRCGRIGIFNSWMACLCLASLPVNRCLTPGFGDGSAAGICTRSSLSVASC